jgi:hypothetical protein
MSGPHWWQSLANRPYLALAERGVDMGDPGFWVLPAVALPAGAVWSYTVTRLVGMTTAPAVVLGATAFAASVLVETWARPWWVASFVPATDGQERVHLLLGISEAVFVVAAVSAAVLSLSLGLGRRAIRIATSAALAAVIATVVAYVVLDLAGHRIGTGGAMVRVSILSTAAGAVAGGSALGWSLRRALSRARVSVGA